MLPATLNSQNGPLKGAGEFLPMYLGFVLLLSDLLQGA